jgi:hypothetical protein
VATAGLSVSTQRGPLGLAADGVKFIYGKKASTQTVAALAATETFYNDTDRSLTIINVRASVGTAPTGAALIADVLVDGVSIFATTTANRPTIAISGNTALAGTPDTTTIAAGSKVTFQVTQIGSGTAGSDLVIQVTAVPA